MSSLTTCKQLTQQPSTTSSKNVSGVQLKSVLLSLSPDCNKTLPNYVKGPVPEIFLFLIIHHVQSLDNQYYKV
jgi:hypothetical protein